MIIDISVHVRLPTCVVLLQAVHTLCVSVLYMHVVFDDKHVLMRARARVCVFTPDLANFYIFFKILIIDFFLSVCWCPFQHGLYKSTRIQRTVAHCIIS